MAVEAGPPCGGATAPAPCDVPPDPPEVILALLDNMSISEHVTDVSQNISISPGPWADVAHLPRSTTCPAARPLEPGGRSCILQSAEQCGGGSL